MATKQELDRLAHRLAYAAASAALDCHSFDVTDAPDDWMDVSGSKEVLADDLRYLDLRGLLVRHPDNPDWVRVLDEDAKVMVLLDPTPLDVAGKIFLDGLNDFLVVDGVRMSMQALVSFVNPNPELYFRGARDGETVIFEAFSREALRTHLQEAR